MCRVNGLRVGRCSCATWITKWITWQFILLGHLVGAGGSLRAQGYVYDGFDRGLATGDPLVGVGGGIGFAAGSSWRSESLDPLAIPRFTPVGLDYRDAMSRPLATLPGAMQLSASGMGSTYARDLAAALDQRPAEYWVSFLLQWRPAVSGDRPAGLYWTPDGVWDRGAAGIQEVILPGGGIDSRWGLVNGQTVDVVSPEQTHLWVVRIARHRSNPPVGAGQDEAQLWLDPLLDHPGLPDAEYRSVAALDAIRDMEAWTIKFAPSSRGSYIVDELRVGASWSDVMPLGLPCDLNGDLAIDAADASILFANWSGSGEGDCLADGFVDAADAGVLFAHWTGDGSNLLVPEGASAAWTRDGAISLLIGLVIRRSVSRR